MNITNKIPNDKFIMDELLNGDLHISKACSDAIKWAKGKSWQEVFETCYRGDWLLWLFKKTNPNDLQLLTLAKGHCVSTVLHLMQDERSKNAVKVAILFGEGVASRDELNAAAFAAFAAAAADAAFAAFAAAAAAAAADAAAAAFAAAADAAAFAADAADARKKNQQATADICRKYLPINLWNINK